MKLIVTSMRNEGPFILEWIAYHRLIGFDHFLIYSNDCDDQSDALLDALDEAGIITHIRNVTPEGKSIQWHAFNQASKHNLVKQAEWVMVLDIDEFVNIRVGAGTLDDLILAAPDADCFALVWQLFGNAGHIYAPNGLVIETYQKAATLPFLADPYQCMVKTLFRNNGIYQKLGVHRPKKRNVERPNPVWVNGNGDALPDAYLDEAIVTYGPHSGSALASINHYSVKSVETFLIKAERGLANERKKPIDVAYWARRNCNETQDTSILRWADPVRRQIDHLCENPTIREPADHCLKWHRQFGRKLLRSEDGRALAWGVAGIERKNVTP